MTKRVSSLVAKSKTYGEELATCPQILGVMDRVLLPRCERYQLHVTQAVRIGPTQANSQSRFTRSGSLLRRPLAES